EKHCVGVCLREYGFQIDGAEEAVFRHGNGGAVAQPAFQLRDNEPIVSKGVQIESDRADAPIVVHVPLAVERGLGGRMARSRLKMVRPEEHPLVPINGADRHGWPISASLWITILIVMPQT